MISKQIELDMSDVNQDILMFCAFRYALGRQSYVVGSIVDIMKANWSGFGIHRRAMYKNEIRDAIKRNRCGSKYDIDEWKKLLALPDDGNNCITSNLAHRGCGDDDDDGCACQWDSAGYHPER